MNNSNNLYIINVFVNEEGNYGNPVGIIVDEEKKISPEERLKLTKESNFSELVFINDIKGYNISIFCPTGEIAFAGQAMIGAAYFLDKQNNTETKSISSMGKEFEISHRENMIWVKAPINSLPKWNLIEIQSREAVEKLNVDNLKNYQHSYVWAWSDKLNNLVRARTFASDWLIPEDEANGSGSMLLAHTLKTHLKILHGKGSVIYANHINEEETEVGGNINV